MTNREKPQEESQLSEDITLKEGKKLIVRLMRENAGLKKEIKYLESRLSVAIGEEFPEELQGLEILQMQELRSGINEVMRCVTEGKRYLLCARRTIRAILRPLKEGEECDNSIFWAEFQSKSKHVCEAIHSTDQLVCLSHRGVLAVLDKAPEGKLPRSAEQVERHRRAVRMRQRKKRKEFKF